MILKDICVVDWGNTELTKSSYVENGRFLAVSAAGCDGKINHYEHESDVSVLSAIGAQCGKMFFPNTKFTAIKNTITLKPKENVLGKYIFYLFTSINLPKRGTGQPFISKGDIEKFVIPQIPPLPIQQKIVAKLDKIFAEIDKAVATAEANVKNANLLIKASIDQLINNFNKNCYVKFGDTCNFVRGPFGGSLKKSIFVDKGYAVYEQQHPINNQFDSFRYFITKDKFNEMKRFEVFPNDLIMSCSGATLGKIAIVPKDAPKGIINQALLKISAKNIIRNTFLKIILESNNFQSILWNASGGAAQPNVPSVKIIKDFLIPLPTLNEQDEFINNVSKIISYNLNFIYNEKRNSLFSLKKSILRQAFNRELVKAA
jgi:type I restriction enzyme S subunit